MAGWGCPDRNENHWDGLITADEIKAPFLLGTHLSLNNAGKLTTTFINVTGSSSSGRDILSGTITYTGSFLVQNGLNFSMTTQGTSNFQQTAGARVNAYIDVDSNSASSTWGMTASSNIATGRAFSKSVTRTFYGGQFAVGGNASSHTNTTFLTHSIMGNAAPSITLGAGSAHTHWAGNFLDDTQVATGKKLLLEGSATAKGDTYIIFQNSRIEFFLNNVLEGYIDATGFVSA